MEIYGFLNCAANSGHCCRWTLIDLLLCSRHLHLVDQIATSTVDEKCNEYELTYSCWRVCGVSWSFLLLQRSTYLWCSRSRCLLVDVAARNIQCQCKVYCLCLRHCWQESVDAIRASNINTITVMTFLNALRIWLYTLIFSVLLLSMFAWEDMYPKPD